MCDPDYPACTVFAKGLIAYCEDYFSLPHISLRLIKNIYFLKKSNVTFVGTSSVSHKVLVHHVSLIASYSIQDNYIPN